MDAKHDHRLSRIQVDARECDQINYRHACFVLFRCKPGGVPLVVVSEAEGGKCVYLNRRVQNIIAPATSATEIFALANNQEARKAIARLNVDFS